ncbi:hypothetical protein NBRC116602_20610 [Hyphomicrobiales bacterium 4NK60-0047b]
MPKPIEVQLVPHDPFWPDMAEDETTQLKIAIGDNLTKAHHIGSTSISSISSKPIIDLLGVVKSLDELDKAQNNIEAIGYVWCYENGIAGRRYAYKNDAETSSRLFQLHCFQENDTSIARHLAFRDYLRLHHDIALKYQNLKTECQLKHPGDSHAYGDCKSDWINKWEQEALKFFN